MDPVQRGRIIAFNVFWFIALLIFLNDTDKFTIGDLVDTVTRGTFHHEPFVILFLVLAVIMLIPFHR